MFTLSLITTTYLSPSGDHLTMCASVRCAKNTGLNHKCVNNFLTAQKVKWELTLFYVFDERWSSINEIPGSAWIQRHNGQHCLSVQTDHLNHLPLKRAVKFTSVSYRSQLRAQASQTDGWTAMSHDLWKTSQHKATLTTLPNIKKQPSLCVCAVFLCAYLWALMDFRHSHFFVLHTHRSPSSPPLSKWDVP